MDWLRDFYLIKSNRILVLSLSVWVCVCEGIPSELPHCYCSSVWGPSPRAPSRGQPESSVNRDPHPQTSQRTGRGMWLLCTTLQRAMREKPWLNFFQDINEDTFFRGVPTHLDWLHGSWPLRRHRQCSGNRPWKSWGETGWVEGRLRAGGCRKSRPRCRSSSEDGEKSVRIIYVKSPHLQLCFCCCPSPYPSLSQSALQFRQLGSGTPGLSDQAFVSDGGAAEIQHHLDRLTLLHPHLPLGQHSHRPHQQLLQEGLGLRQHLK